MGKLNLGRAKGSMWYTGDAMSGKSTEGAVFQNSGIDFAYENDMYFCKNGDVYQCIAGGNPDTAMWAYVGSSWDSTLEDIFKGRHQFYVGDEKPNMKSIWVDTSKRSEGRINLYELNKKLNDCFQSVSDGKTLIASAITDKGVSTDATDPFEVMAENVLQIVTDDGFKAAIIEGLQYSGFDTITMTPQTLTEFLLTKFPNVINNYIIQDGVIKEEYSGYIKSVDVLSYYSNHSSTIPEDCISTRSLSDPYTYYGSNPCGVYGENHECGNTVNCEWQIVFDDILAGKSITIDYINQYFSRYFVPSVYVIKNGGSEGAVLSESYTSSYDGYESITFDLADNCTLYFKCAFTCNNDCSGPSARQGIISLIIHE